MRTATQQDYAERIRRVLEHIQRNLDGELEVSALAKIACFSPFHFHRIFRAMVGEPLGEHVQRLRLERGAFRLKNVGSSVTEAAFEAGYSSHEAFTRAFRARFGQSPSEYRQSHQDSAPSGVYYSPNGDVGMFQPIDSSQGDLMNAQITNLESKKVAYLRHVGPYAEVGETWQKLIGWAGQNGLFGPGMEMIGVCYDDPEITPPDKIRYDACVTLSRDIAPDGDVGVQEIAGGRYAKATHKGPYSKLADSYSALVGQWMPANDLQPAADKPGLEVYLNNPQQTPEKDLLTDILMPLA